MKLHTLSDLHLEFGKMPRNYRPPECDAVILAGDIGVGRSGMAWAMEAFPDKPVIYVAGNHEFYNRHLVTQYSELREKAAGTTSIHFLENDSVEINGVMFIGATLWTDFNLYDDPAQAALKARSSMNDFRLIEGMDVDAWLNMNKVSSSFIEAALAEHAGKPCVVVTHYGPHPRSVHPKYGDDPLNAAYSSRILEEIPDEIRPRLWVHGHAHHSMLYDVGRTRVVCNPRGYVGHELNPDFEQGLVIELGMDAA